MFVSVVIPVYNGEAFLAEAVQSVLDQTHRDFELIVVDDGSTDRSGAILDGFAKIDPRVRVIHQANVGGARARNRALAEARTDWVFSLDHDDAMLPDRIERQLAFLARHPDVKVFASRAYYINKDGRIIGNTKLEPFTTRAQLERYVASGGVVGLNHSSIAMHRPTILAVGGYRPAFQGAEDIDLWNRVLDAGHLVLQQEDILTKYRIHEGSVMTSQARRNWEVCEWAVACMRARRAGRPEPSRAEFQAQWRARPLWQRFAHERLMIARIHYRAAGFDVANRRWLHAAGHLLLAAAARPTYTFSRLAAQVPLPRRNRATVSPA